MKFLVLIFGVLLTTVVAFGQASTGQVTGLQRRYPTTSIAATATTSSAIELGGYTLNGLIMPGVFVGTAVTFTASDTLGGTYVPVYSTAGAALSYTVAASRYVAINPLDIQGCRFIKIVSNAAETGGATIILALNGGSRF